MSTFEAQDRDRMMSANPGQLRPSTAPCPSAALQAYWAAAPDPALALSADGTVTAANPAAQTLFPDCAELIGRHLDELIDGGSLGCAQAPQTAAQLVAALAPDAKGERQSWSLRNVAPPVDVCPEAVDLGPFDGGTLLLLRPRASEDRSASAPDLRASEQRQQAAQLRELKHARYAAEMANRAKSEFLAAMNHELRTPINAVIGFTQIMRSQLHGPLGSQRYVAYVRDIQESAERLMAVVNDVLDVSRIEAGHLVLMPEPTTLDALFTACERLIAPRADAQQVSLNIESPTVSNQLFVDPRFMKQVLVNLLSNAVKFTPAGGRVHVSADRISCGGIRVRVADTGIGIPLDQVKRIFEPFVQADGSLARPFEGSGMGLMLVRSLTELHGGTVAIDSQPDRGTIMDVNLPASRVVEPTVDPGIQ